MLLSIFDIRYRRIVINEFQVISWLNKQTSSARLSKYFLRQFTMENCQTSKVNLKNIFTERMVDMKKIADYTLLCRTCLALGGDVKLVDLNEPIQKTTLKENKGVTHMDCLIYCMHISNAPGMPAAICANCSSTLKIVYAFMKNAFRAQEILKRKLLEMREIKYIMQRKQKGEHQQCPPVESKKSKQFRCKVCDVKLEGKISLKKHVKLHLDLIVYKCQVCTYESRGRVCLSEHYLLEHNLRATAEQLKPKTLSSLEVQKQSCIHENPQINENTERHSTTTSNPMSKIISRNEVHTFPKQKILVEDCPLKEESLDDQAVSSNCDSILKNKVKINKPMPLPLAQNDVAQMDVDDLIIEESGNSSEEMLGSFLCDAEYLATGDKYVANADHKIVNNIKCKTCIKSFSNQRELKVHMLSHNELPHFFCDNCTFYTFFKEDLHQHYRSKHNIQPTSPQLQPKNKHFKEIRQSHKGGEKTKQHVYACNLCLFESSSKLQFKHHCFENHQIHANEIYVTPKIGRQIDDIYVYNNQNVYLVDSLMNAPTQFTLIVQNTAKRLHRAKFDCPKDIPPDCKEIVQGGPSSETTSNDMGMTQTTDQASLVATSVKQPAHVTTGAERSVEKQKTINKTDALDFGNDTLFEDFDDVKSVNNEKKTNFHELRLTPDDNFDDEKNNVNNSEQLRQYPVSFCVHCQKNFLSQYEFENHVFIRRLLFGASNLWAS
uniref:Uncharacterized protein n=1 Tax=Glossina morsitans morsitans TaxID=37546 RepID=A0A1B0FJX4_GLOMM